MEFKEDDFVLMRNFQDQEFLALKKDYFKDKPLEEVIEEAMEEKKEVEIIVEPEPEPSEEELAEIAKQKEIAELKAKLEALEK
jgi:NDP-sugar pyrophosphorylase family protein